MLPVKRRKTTGNWQTKYITPNKQGIVFAAVFAVLGIATLIFASAGPPTASLEAEGGTRTEDVQIVQAAEASAGQAIKFIGMVAPPPPPPASGVLWMEDFAVASDMDNLVAQGTDAIGINNDPESSSNGHESISFHADHDLSCGAPTTTREIMANNAWPRHNYWCPNAGGHFMTAFNGTSYVSFGFAPRGENGRAKVFPDIANKVCIDVNITGLGNRRWWDVAVVSEATYLSHMFPTNVSGLPGGAITNQPALVYFDADHAIEGLTVGMDADFLFVTHEGSRHVDMHGVHVFSNHEVVDRFITDKASRFKTCLKDNGNNSVTHTQNRPDGSVMTTVMPNTKFPDGNKVFIIMDKTYNADKAENPAAVTNPYTLHWDNFVISAE